jgi:small neutral amino acid transporter SnatA (MarC family)
MCAVEEGCVGPGCCMTVATYLSSKSTAAAVAVFVFVCVFVFVFFVPLSTHDRWFRRALHVSIGMTGRFAGYIDGTRRGGEL